MLSLAFLTILAAAPADDAAFETLVRPVLVEQCAKCHGEKKASGGLRLDSRAAMLKGGENGPAFVLGKADESLIVKAVRRAKGVEAMPPDKPLPPATVAAFEKWIAAGAVWPASAGPVTAAKHWAFEPVRDSAVPSAAGVSHRNPIDAFLAVKHQEHGLTPVGRADARPLIRRVTYDLTGLPPTPAEVEAFVEAAARDHHAAFDRLIDRLLASPRYGEKWGRHWLDVVRYADTAGETADYPVPQAWRYRNYIIDAFNKDTPYDRFLTEQIAGDILAARLPAGASQYSELITATGYLAVARRFGFDVLKDHFLTIEDTIDTVGKSVLGLTIACARCHDHKYDPISAADYYALYGIFESTRYPHPGSEKNKSQADFVRLLSGTDARFIALKEDLAQCERAAATAEEPIKKANVPTRLIAEGDIPNGGKQGFADGKGAAALATVAVRKGEMIRLTVLPKMGHGADSTLVEFEVKEHGSNGRVWNLTDDVLPDLYENGHGCQHADGHGNKAVWHFIDVTGVPRLMGEFIRDAEKTPGLHMWRGAEPWPAAFANTNATPIKFMTVSQPARSLALHPGPAGGAAIAWQSPIDGTVSINGRVVDIDPSGGDGIAWTIAHGSGLGQELAAARDALAARDAARQKAESFEAAVPRAYAVAEGGPHDAQLHKRGDPEVRGAAVPRRFLTVLGGQPLPPGSGSGRLQLAGWLADAKNPLTARVFVNRVWQQHFGHGLVTTPNDFGTRGAAPSHPELLDWLAARFVEDGWSIKALHKRIVTSEAYQRATTIDERNAKADADNVYLSHFNRRRLSAEEIRDALLAVSGDLDPTPGGPHPFPEPKTWGFTQHAPFTAVYETNRRSVYLMAQRIKRHPFLALFDGPDPNSSTPERQTTTVPTQALFFLNDPFVHARAESLATKLLATPDGERLDAACRLLYGRGATAREKEIASRFRQSSEGDAKSIWAAWLRVMFGSNEFVYVD